jgi:hypothetical protein
MTKAEESSQGEAVVIKGPFRGARVLVVPPSDGTATAAQQLVSRVRFVTMPADPLVVRSANLAVGVERCVPFEPHLSPPPASLRARLEPTAALGGNKPGRQRGVGVLVAQRWWLSVPSQMARVLPLLPPAQSPQPCFRRWVAVAHKPFFDSLSLVTVRCMYGMMDTLDRSIKKQLLVHGHEQHVEATAAAAAAASNPSGVPSSHDAGVGGARPQQFFVLEQVEDLSTGTVIQADDSCDEEAILAQLMAAQKVDAQRSRDDEIRQRQVTQFAGGVAIDTQLNWRWMYGGTLF